MRLLLVNIFNYYFRFFKGQTISTKNNENDLYSNTIDTLVSMVLSKYPNVQIVICSSKYVLENTPDFYHNHKVFKSDKFKGRRKFEGAIWIKMDPNNTNKDTVAIFTTIRRQTKKQMLAWEYPSQVINYTVMYKIQPDSKIYELFDIKEGMFIY